MARPRLMPPEHAELADEIDGDFDDVSKLVADQDGEENELLAELDDTPGDVKMTFTVRKCVPNQKETAFCFNGTRADLPIMERLQNEFDGGKFLVYISRNGKLYRKKQVTVLKPVRPVFAAPTQDPALVEAIRQQGALLEKMMTHQPQTNFGQILKDAAPFVAAAAPIIAGLFNRAAPDPSAQMLVMVQTMQALKEMSDPQSSDRETGFLDVINTIGPKLIDGITRTQQGAPPQRLASTAAPQASPPTAPPPEDKAAAELRAQLDTMIVAARKNADVDLLADVIETIAEPDVLAVLRAPGAIDILIQAHPAIAPHRAWFERVLHSLANSPNELGDASQNTNPPVVFDGHSRGTGGRSGDATDNEGADTGG